jgi:GNAT superfamily N-acetyltransferase
MSGWRAAAVGDDDAIAALCEGGGGARGRSHATAARLALGVLRREPDLGRALVLDDGGAVRGYAFVIGFWSNELGGHVRAVDEIFIEPALRRRGHARALIAELSRAEAGRGAPIAVALSAGARSRFPLHERLAFIAVHRLVSACLGEVAR